MGFFLLKVCGKSYMCVRVKWKKPKQPKPPYLSVYTEKFPDVYLGALLTLQVLYLLIVM